MHLGRIAAAVQALAINAVTIYGVFGLHWPVGTAIALYWSENVLRGILILALLSVWQLFSPRTDDAGIDASGKFTVRKSLLFSVAFNAAHAVFLVVLLGFVVPRMSPAQRFDAGSFREGLILVSILLAMELLVWLLGANRTSDDGVQQSANAYVRRVVVVHLTIVFGMFGIVLFDRPAALFASFAALKTVVDLSIPKRRPSASDQTTSTTNTA